MNPKPAMEGKESICNKILAHTQNTEQQYIASFSTFFLLIFGRLKIMHYFCAPKIQFSTMKKDIHPKSYRLVVFKDMSNDYAFLCKSTVQTKDTIQWEDGNEYPLVKLEISSASHPFFTGKVKLVDTAGRVDKFMSKYQKQLEKKKASK